MSQEVIFQDLGLIDYKEAWDYQTEIFQGILNQKKFNRSNPEQAKTTKSHLLFCQHPHVYTLGKSGKPEHLLVDEQGLQKIQATYYKINRGGDITYHGPGQIVGYPILDLDNFFTDIHKYLRLLEEAVILTIAEYGLKGGRIDGATGVWLDWDNENARKICAFGVHASRWVTMHGFAFNVNSNLDYFRNIVPCGIDDKDVASMHTELGRELNMKEVEGKLKKHLENLFEMKLVGEGH